MIDRVIEIKDLDKTDSNKALVKNFVEDILVNGKIQNIEMYFNGDDYIQRNPNIPDQLSGLGGVLRALTKQGVS